MNTISILIWFFSNDSSRFLRSLVLIEKTVVITRRRKSLAGSPCCCHLSLRNYRMTSSAEHLHSCPWGLWVLVASKGHFQKDAFHPTEWKITKTKSKHLFFGRILSSVMRRDTWPFHFIDLSSMQTAFIECFLWTTGTSSCLVLRLTCIWRVCVCV